MATETSTTVDIFGLTEWNEMIKVTSVVLPPPALVGGTIFYIDDTADGVYKFFDSDGNVIESVGVGDKPYAYKIVTPGTTDKYYVYHDELYEGNWTYYKDGAYVYEYLGMFESIGWGKTNTETVMAKDSGAYVTADSGGYPTIWYKLQQVRNARTGGCDDWFVPSADEAEELRKAIGFQVVPGSAAPVILPAGKVTGGVIAGTADGQAHYRQLIDDSYVCYPSTTKFLNTDIWSSSESRFAPGESSHAYCWQKGSQSWFFTNSFHSKGDSLSVFFTRAF